MGDGEVGDEGDFCLSDEVFERPADGVVRAFGEVEAFGEEPCAGAACEEADDGAAAEQEAAGFEFCDETAGCACEGSADGGPDGFADAGGDAEVASAGGDGGAGAVAGETVEGDEVVEGLDGACGEALGEFLAGVGHFVVEGGAGDAEFLIEFLAGDGDAVGGAGGELGAEDIHAAVEGGEVSVLPCGLEGGEGVEFGGREGGGDGEHEFAFLDPAAGEGVEGEDGADDGEAAHLFLPCGDFGGFGFCGAWRAGLVEEEEDGFADPREDFHFHGDVA